MLRDYKVTRDVMQMTKNDAAIYLHCLPSLHDDGTDFGREHPDLCLRHA